MVEIVKSGGWLMAPIILCAIIAMGIILERFWTLQQKRVIPEDLTSKVWGWVKKDQLDQKQIQSLHQGSPLGQILAAGLINRDRERAVMKDSIEDTGRHVVHELERYLETLGTIAAIYAAAGAAGHGDRHGQGIHGDHDARRRQSDGAGRRHRRGADHDGGRTDRRDPGADRLPLLP